MLGLSVQNKGLQSNGKKYEDSRLDGTWKNTGKGLRSYIGLSLKTVEMDVQISMN